MTSTRLLKVLLLCPLFLLLLQQSWAQTKTLTGTVKDEKGNPVQGASVTVRGGSAGTTTDATGSFSLNVPANANVITVSYVGLTPQEITITGKNSVDVTLSSVAQSLNDVVVVGYTTARRKDVTGAVSSISSANFNNGVVTNPMDQIQGKVAGLVITQAGGDPNSTPTIRLRGQTSLTGGQSPLIVLDGVPLDDPDQISNIPPQDIASYDVLKDASATAIYGARGANGVIIINTKKGRAGRVLVDYSGYAGVSTISKKYDMLNASEWKAGAAQVGTSPADIATYDKGANTDWLSAITRDAFVHSHDLGISGGSGGFSYRASASYLNQQGIVINTGKEQVGLRFNAQQKALNDRLDLQVGIINSSTLRKRTDYNIFTYVYSSPPTYPVYNTDGSYFGYSDFAMQNPVAQQNMQLNQRREKFNQLYGTANFTLIQGLILGTTGSLNYFNRQDDWFQPTLPAVNNLNNGSRFNENRSSQKGNIHLNYLKDFGVHNINAMAVYEYNNFMYDNFNAAGAEFLVEQNQNNSLQNGNSAKNSISSYKDKYTLISFLGRVAYNYKNKYYITASFRRDGSSKFGPENRWGNFPSASVAWRLTQEDFLKGVTWLNELKINAGFGITGNQEAINPYNTQLLLGSVGRYYNAANGTYPQAYAPTQNANPQLKWEERHGRNIGADFTLFNNRLSGNVNYFNDKTKNLLYTYSVPVPPFFVNNILANVGELVNKGFEAQLSGDIIKGNKFSWTANGQITFINTTVTSLSGDYAGNQLTTDKIPAGYAQGRGLSASPITYLKVGYSPNVFFLPHYVGLDASGHQLFSDGKGGTITQDKITDNEKFYIDPAPDFSYGFGSTFSYGNLSLNFFLRGLHGQKVFNNTRLLLDNIKRLPGNNVTKEALTNGIKDAAVASDLWLDNASYLRLDNATISYNFKNVKGLENLRAYISGNNLFVITKYKGLDPEINTGNNTSLAYIDANYNGNGYYPKTRSFTIGVNLSFK